MSAILPELFPAGMDRPARVQLAPARADLRPVAADDPGHVGQGLGRQRQRGTVEKHRGPRADEGDCGDRFIYQEPLFPRRRHGARDQPVNKPAQNELKQSLFMRKSNLGGHGAQEG